MKVLEFEVPARLAHTRLAEISIVTSLRHPCVVCRVKFLGFFCSKIWCLGATDMYSPCWGRLCSATLVEALSVKIGCPKHQASFILAAVYLSLPCRT